MKARIIADTRFDALGADTIDLDLPTCRHWVERALDDGIEAVIVVGDDATLSMFATAFTEVTRDRSEQLWFAPLGAGELDTAVDQVGAGRASDRALKKLVRRVEHGDGRRQSIPMLSIVDSALAAPRLGFSFGMGAFTALFGPQDRVRRRDALRAAVAGSEPIDADVRIDWERATTRFGYLLASSVDTSWVKTRMGGPASIRVGASPLELVRGATKLGRMVERASGGTASKFGCVHIDTNSDYVVDGVAVSVDCPRLITLTPGPQLHILV